MRVTLGNFGGSLHRRVVTGWLALGLLAGVVFITSPSAPAAAAGGHRFPLSCSYTWYHSTYNGHGFASGGGSGPPTRYNAIDLNMAGTDQDRGKGVYATYDGTVRRIVGSNGQVEIQHATGTWAVYAHMSSIRVRVGSSVKKGDRIGDVGSKGAGGSHLHYEQLNSDRTPRHLTFGGTKISYTVTPPNGPRIPSWWCTAGR